MRDTSVARLGWGAVLFGLASILLLAASALGYRQDWWPVLRALDVASWGAWAAIAGAALAMAALCLGLARGRSGGGIAVLGLVLSLPVLIAAGAWQYATLTTPPINDISTDTEDPPVFWFTATPSDYPAQNAEPQRAAYPDVRPLETPVSADEAFAAALALVEERGWEVLSADPAESQIEAIARSRVFGFEDEVAIRFSETDTGTRIDMRSRSRLGQIDRGANARRIEAYLADLETRTPN
ncbi:DUF1499 domain-containing protein [Thiosulfatihalobacter marinus]|uniref:DUF1499 domain-containing protein n=1 Tax=Thiosulfatihalobacter marinus TaxID=2792481 RepID=UPI0018D6D8E7|nr:DUF1499 domain-containing protein [Thiosulfatihalobacter marinus]